VFIRRRLENYRNKNQNSLKLQGKKLKFAKITRAKNQNSLKLPEPNLKSINVKNSFSNSSSSTMPPLSSKNSSHFLQPENPINSST
jgi:hypothetical protein